MASTNPVDQFKSDWTKTLAWSKANNIGKPAIDAVYSMDAKRLQRGTNIMSQAERYRAVLAASGMNYSTVLPTDTNQPSHVVDNVRSTLWHVFTGLNPEGLAKNLWHTVGNTIEHPGTTFKALTGTAKAIAKNVKHPTTSALTEFVPGLLDVYKLSEGEKGLTTLASHPVSALLDVASAGSILGKGAELAGFDVGDIAANRLGISREELGKDSVYRNLGKIIGTAKTPKWLGGKIGLGKDALGNLTYGDETISQTVSKWATNHHVGHVANELMYGALSKREKFTNLSIEQLKPIDDIMHTMTEDKRNQILTLLTKSGKSINEIVNTSALPIDVRSVITYYDKNIREPYAERVLSTGKVAMAPMPTGKSFMYDSHTASYVQRKADDANNALQSWEDRKQEADVVHQQASQLDTARDQEMVKVGQIQQSLWDYMNASVSSVDSDLTDKLRTGITAKQRWESGQMGRINKDRIYRLVTREGSDLSQETLAKLGLPLDGANVRGTAELTKSHINVLVDVFKPGGVLDQMKGAAANLDYKAFRDLALIAKRRIEGKFAMEINIKAAPQMLDQLRQSVDKLYQEAKVRKTLEDKFNEIMEGKMAKGKKTSVTQLAKAYMKAQHSWDQAVMDHYPPVYKSVYLDILTKKILEHEGTPEMLAKARVELAQKGWKPETIDKLGTNPRNFVELLSRISESTYNDPLVGKTFNDIQAAVESSAKKELAELRARPDLEPPHYVPTITTHEMADKTLGTYDVYLGNLTKIPGLSATHAKELFNYGSTVNNFMAAVTASTKEALGKDAVLEYHDEYLKPLTYIQKDLETSVLLKDPVFQRRLADAANPDTRGSIIDDIMTRDLGLMKWNPDEFFGISTGRVKPGADNQMWIPKSVADIANSIVEKGQFPMTGITDKITRLFKFSILGLSPRFTLHVAVGGTYMLAAKINPTTFRFIGDAYKMVKQGTLHDSVMHSITQEGNEGIAFHYMAGRTSIRMAIEKRLTDLGIDPKAANIITWMKQAANINFTFTRFIGNMQRALAFFDGVGKVEKQNFITDETGKRQLVTSDRALFEGRKAVERVMGDLRSMSPFERQVITRAIPFYGWTKHVLKYVTTMPIDHPFRAQIFGNMAEANSQDVQSGLPTRIQLLFFLGQPDASGNVTAITDRFADPLRTVANYASVSGIISALNPMITSAFAYVDPQIVYGSNSLYPTATFTKTFGIETGKAEGNLLTSAEQIVPELGSLDVAFGLSNQYRGLAKSTPAAFKKDLFESLNIPMLNVQHINLKQIAAKDELDRYHVALNAATTALRTGDLTALNGYGPVPYPLNDVYNITPQQLKALYETAMRTYGLPPQDVVSPPQSPSLI